MRLYDQLAAELVLIDPAVADREALIAARTGDDFMARLTRLEGEWLRPG